MHLEYQNQAMKIIFTSLFMLVTLMCGFQIKEKTSCILYFIIHYKNCQPCFQTPEKATENKSVDPELWHVAVNNADL